MSILVKRSSTTIPNSFTNPESIKTPPAPESIRTRTSTFRPDNTRVTHISIFFDEYHTFVYPIVGAIIVEALSSSSKNPPFLYKSLCIPEIPRLGNCRQLMREYGFLIAQHSSMISVVAFVLVSVSLCSFAVVVYADHYMVSWAVGIPSKSVQAFCSCNTSFWIYPYVHE